MSPIIGARSCAARRRRMGWRQRQTKTAQPAATNCAAYSALKPASSPACQTFVWAMALPSMVDLSAGASPDFQKFNEGCSKH